jgi:hypothetical protein
MSFFTVLGRHFGRCQHHTHPTKRLLSQKMICLCKIKLQHIKDELCLNKMSYNKGMYLKNDVFAKFWVTLPP